ncbi:unnamed protein product [Lactuca saligna]|uniref:Uncharacterized protein n=1 Tax=Lactuca saligna TaxID=75948 RepID=A0AA35ZRN9_LACSI|nr:unnamed protein product [Lactuca saligna]
MIASEKRHNTNLLDASFSSYATQERFIIKLSHPQINTKKKVQDDELGIFGAEKYFTGAIDEELNKTAHYRGSNRPQEKHEEPCPKPKLTTPPSGTPSVRSESSWNSRRGLLASNGNEHKKKTGVKSLFASLGCNCNDNASVKVTNNKVRVNEAVKPPVKTGDLGHKTKSLSNRWADDDVPMKKFEFDELNLKRDDCFTFPVLNSSMADGKHSEPPELELHYSSEVFGSPGKKSFSLERKLTMLNWDGVTPRADIIDISRNGGHNDTGSDASSDLFEIESFSTNENNSFLSRQALENSEGRPSNVNGYAPSEASVDWSVVTACAADFSTADDFAVARTVKAKGDTERVKGSGILSGCHSHKAVRVSGDEYCMTGGGDKVAGIAAPSRREWCRRLDSVTPIAKIHADTKLVGVGSDSNRGQNGFGTTRSVPRMHASKYLYSIPQQ